MKKMAVLTGSTGGIGQQIATRLAADNWNLLLINRSAHKAQKQVSQLSLAYPNLEFHSYQADFIDLDSVQRVAQQIRSQHDQIHALYNVAGCMTNQLVHSQQGVESQFAVNALAPYVLTTALKDTLAKGAQQSKGALVVNFTTSMISSIKTLDLATVAAPEKIEAMGKTYAAAKLVVNVFNQAVSASFAKEGISVLAVDPGPTKTAMTENMPGVPWIFKLLMPLMTKDVNKQTDKLMKGIDSAVSHQQTGLFISEGKVKKEHALALDRQLQQQTLTLLEQLSAPSVS